MRPLVTALALAGAVMASSCGLLNRAPEIRYRITVAIETPHGLRTASGVWSMKLRPGGIDQGYNSRFRGEAIPVDLPNGQTVFALLDFRGSGNGPAQGVAPTIAEQALTRAYYPDLHYPDHVGASRSTIIQYLKTHHRDRIQLDCDVREFGSECPLLVTFANPANPFSVFALDPDDLASTIGSGYRLRGIYLQVTDDPPSHQIGNRLPWLANEWDRYLGRYRNKSNGMLATKLTKSSFEEWAE